LFLQKQLFSFQSNGFTVCLQNYAGTKT
jgi:hypothetical protein